MIGFYSAGAMGQGSGPPPAGFWSAIASTNPEVWLKLNEASGATAANSGSGSDGTYGGTIAYDQGALSSQAGANSIATSAPNIGYVDCPSAAGELSGVIGICYAGIGGFSSGAAVLWRTSGAGTGGSYLRIDTANIFVQLSSSSGFDTGVLSSTITDGNPHLIIVGKTTDDSGKLSMWIDGVHVFAVDSATLISLENKIYFTRNGSRSQYCYGRYADAFVARNVSAAQIAAINSAWSP